MLVWNKLLYLARLATSHALKANGAPSPAYFGAGPGWTAPSTHHGTVTKASRIDRGIRTTDCRPLQCVVARGVSRRSNYHVHVVLGVFRRWAHPLRSRREGACTCTVVGEGRNTTSKAHTHTRIEIFWRIVGLGKSKIVRPRGWEREGEGTR